MAIEIIKKLNKNIWIIDTVSGQLKISMLPDISDIRCVNEQVKITERNGNVEFINPNDVVSLQIEPNLPFAFSGDCSALLNKLATDFFICCNNELNITDIDAYNFISKANYSLSMYKTAINNLVVNLKDALLWDKVSIAYPLLSDSILETRANQVKYNLKNPQDTDSAFRLKFFGGVTYTGTGVLFGGVNGYANTYYKPNMESQNSVCMTIYSLSNTQVTANDIGSTDNPLTSGLAMLIRDASNNFSSRTNQLASNTVSNTTSLGLYGTNRTGANLVNLWRNSTKLTTQLNPSVLPNNFDIYIGARNDGGTATLFSNREYAFATVGKGLTDDEFGNLDAIIQNFMFETGRVIYRYV